MTVVVHYDNDMDTFPEVVEQTSFINKVGGYCLKLKVAIKDGTGKVIGLHNIERTYPKIPRVDILEN